MPNDAKADPDITVTDELDPADAAVITDGLRAYDLSQTGYYDFRPLAVEAPGFYQKQGYDVAATIDRDPPGLTRYYMMKKL